MSNKKVNPRRIPLAKRDINKDEIINSAMRDDMAHAWYLVATALLEQELVSSADIPALCEEVNQFSLTARAEEVKLVQAEKLMGRKRPKVLSMSRVKSKSDLEKFKKNVEKVALHTSLAVICLGLEKRFSDDILRRVFLSADLTEAEVDSGRLTWKDLEQELREQMITITISSEA